MPDSESATFEIGIVLAGAVSAGAYTAGAIDFLIHALDRWHEAHEAEPERVPPPNVKIRTISGASAGGMTAAITGALLEQSFEPVTDVDNPGPTPNALYESWVQRIDIAPLLDTTDLEEDGTVRSLLNSRVLDRIAANAFDFDPADAPRPYVAEPLEIYLSVSNLRGVPYRIEFQESRHEGHGITLHADHLDFALSRSGASVPGALPLDPTEPDAAEWDRLAEGALATGAFPIGLRPREVTKKVQQYEEQHWAVPLADPVSANGSNRCRDHRTIPPAWNKQGNENYRFTSVDGGLMDNEPLELARRALVPDGEERNPRDPGSAQRAILLMDPFPDQAHLERAYREPEETNLLEQILGMFGALRAQARFKPDELMLADDGSVYSRFMLIPTRRDEHDERADYPLACGPVRGFGGFLCDRFRKHDYQLGRRNCQQFLRNHFVIPESAENPIFDDWTKAHRDRFRYEPETGSDREKALPIVPLVGEVSEPVEKPTWPTFTDDELRAVRLRVKKRTEKAVPMLIDQYSPLPWWANGIVKRLAWPSKKGSVVDRMEQQIEQELGKRGLMS